MVITRGMLPSQRWVYLAGNGVGISKSRWTSMHTCPYLRSLQFHRFTDPIMARVTETKPDL